MLFFIMFYQKCDFLVSERVIYLRCNLQSAVDKFLSVFTFIYFCPLFLLNYSTYLDNVNFSIFISFYYIFFCTSNDQSFFFLVSIWRLCKLFQISFLEYQNIFTISGRYVTKPTMVKYVNTHIHFYAYCIRSFAIVVIYG